MGKSLDLRLRVIDVITDFSCLPFCAHSVVTLLKTKKRIKILALTFSNMAAEEMKSRIEEDVEISDLIDNVNHPYIQVIKVPKREENCVNFNSQLNIKIKF